MGKLMKVVLGAVVAAVLAAPAMAQDDTSKAQSKLLAYRAARADAMRKLSERINGLAITSETSVKDFVAESDSIRTAMTGWLVGMKEKSVRYLDDGSAEVTLEVALQTVITELKQIYNAQYKGSKFKVSQFEEMKQYNKVDLITETGNGAPRPPVWQGEAPVAAGVAVTGGLPNGMSTAAWAYWKENVTPQQRLMAVRAANLDGKRKLAERIAGVFIVSNTQVKDFITESDTINARTSAILVGVREKAVRYHVDEPIVEVTVEVTLQTIYETVKQDFYAKYKGDSAKIRAFEERTQTIEKTVLEETGMGVARTEKTTEIMITAVSNSAKWPAAIRATGNAAIDDKGENAAQAKLMAFRGAELDARRKLAEQIDGLMLTSSTSVQDFVAQNDEIRTQVVSFQQNARVLDDSKKVLADGSVEVTVEIDPQPLWDLVLYYQKQMNITVK